MYSIYVHIALFVHVLCCVCVLRSVVHVLLWCRSCTYVLYVHVIHEVCLSCTVCILYEL